MIFTTRNGEDLALLLALPNWDAEMTVELQLPTAIETAISGRESRRPFARSFRYSLGFTTLLDTAKASTDLRLWLLRLKGETVGVPLWTDGVELSSAANAGATSLPKTAELPVRSGAEWIILNSDASVWEIVVVTAVSSNTVTLSSPGLTLNWPAGTMIYPLLFGRFVDRPQAEAITDEVTEAELKLQEDSPYARRLNATAVTIATAGAGVPDFPTMPLWTERPDHTRVLDREEVDIIYKAIGFLRTDQQYVYAQFPRRGVEMAFEQFDRASIRSVEWFFVDRKAQVRSFLFPTFRGDLRLTESAPTSGASNHLYVENSRAVDPDYTTHAGAAFLALIEANGATEAVRVTHIVGNDLTLSAAVSQSFGLSSSKLCHLLLGRFAGATLTWTYDTDGAASTRISFIEKPDEYANPQTDLPEPLFLYEFTEQLVTPQVSRFTSYETSVTYGGQTWAPAPYSHGAIKWSVKPGKTQATLTSWGGNFPTNPLNKFLPFALDGELSLRILEADFASLATPAHVLFVGTVDSLGAKGPDWQAQCTAFGRLFKRKLFHFLIQRNDNYVQFARATGLDAEDFKSLATLTVKTGMVIHVSGPTQAAPYFAGGWLVAGTGADEESRAILHATPISGGQQLTLNRPLLKSDIGQTMSLYPGYDGTLAQCTTKFANHDNFGGHPFISDTGPQIKAVEEQQVSGGKK